MKFQKVIIFKWICGDFIDKKFINKHWEYKETKILELPSVFSQDPGLYIDVDTYTAYRYSAIENELANICEDLTIPDFDIKCPVYYKYEIRKYNNSTCEGSEYVIIGNNLICECMEDSIKDCYDLLWNKNRITSLDSCTPDKEGKSNKIVIVDGPFSKID